MRQLKFISPPIVEALCGVIQEGLDRSVSKATLQRAARIVCRDAHACDYSVERMIVELKHEWSSLMDSFHFPHGPERTELMNRLMTFCIDEYFRTDSSQVGERVGGVEDVATIDDFLGTRRNLGPISNEARRSHPL
jgi:hypothetical protein